MELDEPTCCIEPDLCSTEWDQLFLDILLDVKSGVSDISAAVTYNHTVTIERVDVVIGFVVSILSILTVKIAIVQIMQQREKIRRARAAEEL